MTARASIVLTPDGGLTSADITSADITSAFGSMIYGLRLRAIAPIDFGPYGRVEAGDTGRVTYVNLGSGEVQVTVDRYIPEMAPWENSFTLMPYETDELLSRLRYAPRLQPISSRSALAAS